MKSGIAIGRAWIFPESTVTRVWAAALRAAMSEARPPAVACKSVRRDRDLRGSVMLSRLSSQRI